ncbi:30679_t:CDS:2 [Gigaspora margarita]|uniref:30679_t:CDS:1 n=1 Tax=Gigaspora margarita TaxID=4874 RepID=A0ABN7W4M4_GIGMA|nr:30679_t:CDS:2 [Gigaspora margarita]
MSSSDEDISTSTSNIEKSKKNLGGRPDGPVWNYFTKGEKVGKGRYKATCNFCSMSWNRGEPIELESHLANHCSMADSTVIRYFLAKILSNTEKDKPNKKRKSNIYGKLDQHVSIIELDQQKIKRIHLAWTRAFAICGIPWNVIENPFFIEALKETNLSYKPPICKFLAGHLLEQQLALINQKTNNLNAY